MNYKIVLSAISLVCSCAYAIDLAHGSAKHPENMPSTQQQSIESAEIIQNPLEQAAPTDILLSKQDEHPENKGFTMEPHIGISKANLGKIGTSLNKLLADEFALYVKLLNYHWNMKTKHFHSLHAFFKELYEFQFDIVDDIAERAQTMGVVAYGSMADFTKHTQLKEASGKKLTDQQMLKDLLNDYETIIRSMRTAANNMLDYDDIGTNNFLTDILEKHEKKAWMIRSSIE